MLLLIAELAGPAAGLKMRAVCRAWRDAIPWKRLAADYSWTLAAEAGVRALRRRARKYYVCDEEVERALLRALQRGDEAVAKWLGDRLLCDAESCASPLALRLAVRASPKMAVSALQSLLRRGRLTTSQQALAEDLARAMEQDKFLTDVRPPRLRAPWNPWLDARLALLAGKKPDCILEGREGWEYPEVAAAFGRAPSPDPDARESTLALRAERWAAQQDCGPEALLEEIGAAGEPHRTEALGEVLTGLLDRDQRPEAWAALARLAATSRDEALIAEVWRRTSKSERLHRECLLAAAAHNSPAITFLLRVQNAEKQTRVEAARVALAARAGLALDALSRGFHLAELREALGAARAAATFESALRGGWPGGAAAIYKAFPEAREEMCASAARAFRHNEHDLTAAGWLLAHRLSEGRLQDPPDWARAGRLCGLELHVPLLDHLRQKARAPLWYAQAVSNFLPCARQERSERFAERLLAVPVNRRLRRHRVAVLIWRWPVARLEEFLGASWKKEARAAAQRYQELWHKLTQLWP